MFFILWDVESAWKASAKLCSSIALHVQRFHNKQWISVANLQGLCRDIKNFLKAYIKKWVLSVHALMVLTIFCFLVEKKINLKVLACSFEIT